MNSIDTGVSQRPREVGHEHDRALEDADEQDLAAGVVGVDLRRQLGAPCSAICLLGDEHRTRSRASGTSGCRQGSRARG